MKSKRSSVAANESETKRIKIVEPVEYEVQLGDDIYVNVDLLFQFPAFKTYLAKRYKRSVKRFIDEEKLQVVFVAKKNVKKNELKEKPLYAPKFDVRLVKKDEQIVRLLKIAKKSSYPLAPPVIKDKDLSFFVDKSGVRHQVEMRGKRTMEGIYFKAKDVGRVFESESFLDTIQHPRASYCEGIDFVWFILQHPGSSRSLQSDPDQGHPRDSDTSLQEHDHPSPQEQKRTYHNSHEVFLTFAGLMHALHSTRSPVANEFRDWVYKKVFALAYGTVEQKQEMLSTLCKVDKSFLQAFMKLIPNDLACLYLVDTTMRGDGKKVFKFGRSEKVKERFYKHSSAFGDGVILDTVIFVPSDYLSEAETLLKEALREDDHFTFNKEQELILLDTESYKSVRSIMQTIADKYNGSMAIQAEVHTREIKEQEHKYKLHAKDSEHEYKLRIKDLESMIEVLKERIQNAVADEKAKATVLLSKLEQRLAARDIQLIEEKGKVSMLQQEMTNKVSMLQQEMTNKVSMLQQEMTNKVSMIQQQSTSKLENMELRQKIAAIEHAAEIKEKDRLNGELRARIHELEETNRRLSKNFPEAA
ncbi:Uncharacterized protein P3T76_015096 [Phytophthora citrophthora]|uniref:Bro-N domain-containing protein n=1 Tax=Phytophthora citrophthora TaxID=4793 RepID=A0AAD9FZV4_9STRA|nr:Uncharacterized protein P3T76_015094 [Phytophthora citrophthora]KAK1929343.1 Uncharacterized protein P3T76_015095 [Phytophthora citrophthora]KAK1929344.1 Uncharacterized protein P3T76_015096 [Phytophthora citrophthora]